jgi:hypothetical protein
MQATQERDGVQGRRSGSAVARRGPHYDSVALLLQHE